MAWLYTSWPLYIAYSGGPAFNMKMDLGVEVFFSIAFFALLIAVPTYCIPFWGCVRQRWLWAKRGGLWLLSSSASLRRRACRRTRRTRGAEALARRCEIPDGGADGDVYENRP